MAGTLIGGRRARDIVLSKNPTHYHDIAVKGGSTKHPESRYFRLHPEVARAAGKVGGLNKGKSIKKRKLEAAYKHLSIVAEKARKQRELAVIQADVLGMETA